MFSLEGSFSRWSLGGLDLFCMGFVCLPTLARVVWGVWICMPPLYHCTSTWGVCACPHNTSLLCLRRSQLMMCLLLRKGIMVGGLICPRHALLLHLLGLCGGLLVCSIHRLPLQGICHSRWLQALSAKIGFCVGWSPLSVPWFLVPFFHAAILLSRQDGGCLWVLPSTTLCRLGFFSFRGLG